MKKQIDKLTHEIRVALTNADFKALEKHFEQAFALIGSLRGSPAKTEDRKQIASVIEYLDNAIAEMQRGYERDTAENSTQWLAARNVLRMAREFCYTLDGQCEPALNFALSLVTAQTLDLGRVGKELAPVCTCHERDSSYVCPVCYDAGERGHMEN